MMSSVYYMIVLSFPLWGHTVNTHLRDNNYKTLTPWKERYPGRKRGHQHAALWEGGGVGLVGTVCSNKATSGVPGSGLDSLTALGMDASGHGSSLLVNMQ